MMQMDMRSARFVYEIAVMQKLAGTEGVVQLYDCEEETEGENKTVYLLEEYLTPFSEFLKRPAISIIHIIEMIIGLCGGLIAEGVPVSYGDSPSGKSI